MNVERGSKMVADAAFAVGGVGTPSAGVPYIHALALETAIRIERTTCGLLVCIQGNSSNGSKRYTLCYHRSTSPAISSNPECFGVGSRHDRSAGLEGGTSLERRRFAADLPSSAPLSTEGRARPGSCLV
jgi:hypothetical protein